MPTIRLHSRFPIVALIGGLVIPFASLHANSIPIQNYSFEDPALLSPGDYTVVGDSLPGWSEAQGANYDGVGVEYDTTGLAAYDGNQDAYLNNSESLSQDLGVGLAADTTYTLSVWAAANTPTYPPGTDYSISLWAGSTLLTSVVPIELNDSNWQDLTATYTTNGTLASGDLEIVISNLDSTSAVFSPSSIDVDDVTLTDNPVSSSVPDEGNVTWLAVLAIAAGFCLKRRAFGKSNALALVR
jgi:hapalindole biogenesis HpiC1 cyclase-like protein